MCFFIAPALVAAGMSAATAATVATVATVASVGLTAYAGYEHVQGEKAAAKYEGKVAAVNERLAENKATDALQQGSVIEAQSRAATRQMLGKQTAGFGAQNVAESGTALDILGDTAALGETDIQRIRYNAARQAWGFGMDAYNAKAGNDLTQLQAKTDERGTILSTIGKMGSQIADGFNNGAFSKPATSNDGYIY